MKKILLCLCLLFGYSLANDKNGFFLWFDLGVSEVAVEGGADDRKYKSKISTPMYGIKAGYRHFFTDVVGLQGYFGFRDSFININTSNAGSAVTGNGNKTSTYYSFLPLMANADVIFDLYKKDNFSLDAIVGLV